MQKGRGALGSRKHGVSGRSPKSPRMKHHLKREAEKEEKRRRKQEPLPYDSVEEAVRNRPKR